MNNPLDHSPRAGHFINPPARRRAAPHTALVTQLEVDAPNVSELPEYKVGKGKPPLHSRFKPGQSGNPKGRPRGAKGLNNLVRETLTSKVRVRTPNGETRMSKMEAVLQKTVELAMKGNPRAIMMVVSLYRPAVPDVEPAAAIGGAEEDLSATDLQILEMFREDIRNNLEARP
jgi:hypothetical protein